jgi:predicted ATPase
LQVALGASLVITKGYAAPDAEHAYTRARLLCQQVGESAQLSRVLFALWGVYDSRGQHMTARALAEELLVLAQPVANPTARLVAHHALGSSLYWLGELGQARTHMDHALALEAQQPQASGTSTTALVARVGLYAYAAWTLWLLGYPEQAAQRNHQALQLAHDLGHPFGQVVALLYAAMFHLFRRESDTAQQYAETELALATEHGFAFWAAVGTMMRGWTLAVQGQGHEGSAQMRQGIAACRFMGTAVALATFLTALAEACAQVGQLAEAQRLLDVIVTTHKTIALVFHTQVYKLKRNMTPLHAASTSSVAFMHNDGMEVNDESPAHSPTADCGRPTPVGAPPQGAHDHSGTPGGQSWK